MRPPFAGVLPGHCPVEGLPHPGSTAGANVFFGRDAKQTEMRKEKFGRACYTGPVRQPPNQNLCFAHSFYLSQYALRQR